MLPEKLFENLSIILVRPKYPENIGSAARIALNMGLSQLVVVGKDHYEKDKMYKTATHNAAHLVDTIQYIAGLESILESHSLLVGTTARHGRQRSITDLPEQLAQRALPHLEKSRVGLMFGPENTGLSRSEMKYCGIITSIDSAEFSSLNLAQAVAIICYELRKGLQQASKMSRDAAASRSRTAEACELKPLSDAVAMVLNRLDQVSERSQAESRFQVFSQVISRCDLTAKEAKIIKDTCKQLTGFF